jgi:hypothetical protein
MAFGRAMAAEEQVVTTLMALWVCAAAIGQNDAASKTWLYWSAREP